MKKVFYKISSTLVVIGLVILLHFFSGYMQNFEMTEEEAAKAEEAKAPEAPKAE